MKCDELIKLLTKSPELLNRLQLSLSARLLITSGIKEITIEESRAITGIQGNNANRPIKELVDKGFLKMVGGDRKNGYIYRVV